MQKQARVYMDRAQKCGSRKLWLSVTALNAVSLVAIHSTLIPNQRPLAKDSKISFPFRYLAQLQRWGQRGAGSSGGRDELGGSRRPEQCRPGPPGGKLLSLEMPRSARLGTTNALSGTAGCNLIPLRFQGSSLSNSNIASIRYCPNKRGVRAAEIASVSQTPQSFWGQKFSSSSPCSPGRAEINILTSVNPLFPFSPRLYQLWEGGMGGRGR